MPHVPTDWRAQLRAPYSPDPCLIPAARDGRLTMRALPLPDRVHVVVQLTTAHGMSAGDIAAALHTGVRVVKEYRRLWRESEASSVGAPRVAALGRSARPTMPR